MVEINQDFINGVISYVGSLFSDFKLLILLVMGVFLGIFIIERVISAIITKKEE